MVVFNKVFLNKKNTKTFIASITLRLNLCAKIACSYTIPLTIELGLGLFTFSFEIYNMKKNESDSFLS